MKILFSVLLVILSWPATALSDTGTFEPGKIYKGHTGEEVTINEVTGHVKPGTVVLLGEIHNNETHHQHQRDFLVSISGADFPISVGMEFFNYLDQGLVNRFVENNLAEDEFLKAVKWGKIPFEYYRFQVRLPFFRGGQTYALNAPPRLTRRIAQVGLEELTPEEKALLPPNFELGNDLYYERFVKAVSQHGKLDPKTLEKYWQAQSTWDDTMAWQTVKAMTERPQQTLVVMVGDFHVQYGGGLPHRMRQRGIEQILNISQVAITGLSDDEIRAAILPDELHGPRADYVWVSE